MSLIIDGLLIVIIISNLFLDLGAFLNILASFITLYFSPGYFLINALFSKGFPYSNYLRVPASFGLSIVISGLTLLLQSLIGISKEAVTTVLILSTVILGGLSIIQSIKNMPPVFVDFAKWWATIKKCNWMICGAYAIAIVALTTSFVRFWILTERAAPQFTEFYILGENDSTTNYAEDVAVNTAFEIPVGITNQEERDVLYSIYALVEGSVVGYAESIEIDAGDSWEDDLSVVIPLEGDNQKVSIYLWCEGCEFPYRQLTLWVDVVE